MKQKDRIARALKAHGQLNTVAFVREPTVDGGTPILRLAARIRDLKDDGWQITTRRRLDSTVDYVLLSAPHGVGAPATPRKGASGVAGGEAGAPAPSLFNTDPAAPVRAALADYEAA